MCKKAQKTMIHKSTREIRNFYTHFLWMEIQLSGMLRLQFESRTITLSVFNDLNNDTNYYKTTRHLFEVHLKIAFEILFLSVPFKK